MVVVLLVLLPLILLDRYLKLLLQLQRFLVRRKGNVLLVQTLHDVVVLLVGTAQKLTPRKANLRQFVRTVLLMVQLLLLLGHQSLRLTKQHHLIEERLTLAAVLAELVEVVQLADALAADQLEVGGVADLERDALQDLFGQLAQQPVRRVDVHAVRLVALFQTQPAGLVAGRKVVQRIHRRSEG
uniref:(northern house mosquito) hypothetical protein n=1 Tax=Culex pipiens TaxID=7175 RepID=A0A8D8HCI7_CULPI